MSETASKRTSSEKLPHEELTRRIRGGAMFPPWTPGLLEAAREVLRPMIENLEGREILYDCHVLCLARVESVEMDDSAFRIVATRIKYIDTGRGLMYAPGCEPTQPLDFGGGWSLWYLYQSGIHAQMVCDIFFSDQTFVTAVKAALERGAEPKEILRLVFPEAAEVYEKGKQ